MDVGTKSLNVTLSHHLADGHCFLHGVVLHLDVTHNTMQVYKLLMKVIETERRTNTNQCTNFIDKDSGKLDHQVHKYQYDKIFDHAAGNLIPQNISNALRKPIHICNEKEGSIWKLIVQRRITRQIKASPLLVHLKNYHYSAFIGEKMQPIT
ncbi:hypothetical protein FHG87_022232 [Trinorchestia longiramus]|nr:hypothetical protein FHG87_022232 [Trinorchestia longiramus]